MINTGASQSLMKIEAVETARIPTGSNNSRRFISINLSQYKKFFKREGKGIHEVMPDSVRHL
jgi:hypothetical protein